MGKRCNYLGRQPKVDIGKNMRTVVFSLLLVVRVTMSSGSTLTGSVCERVSPSGMFIALVFIPTNLQRSESSMACRASQKGTLGIPA